MKSLLTAPLSLAITLLAQAGYASQSYPAELLEYYALEALPVPGDGCTLCHSNDVGGNRTVVTPYGRALMTNFNALGNSVPSLLGALANAEAAGWDSDQDGAPDADELRAGADPNSYDGAGEPPPLNDIPLPETGCSLGVPGADGGAWMGVFVALGVLLAAARQAHQRRP